MLVANPDAGPEDHAKIEIKGEDIPSYFSPSFWLAVRFWKHARKYPPSFSEWRRMTIQQSALIDLFDGLQEARRP